MEDIIKKGGSSSASVSKTNATLDALKKAYLEVVEFEKNAYQAYKEKNPKYKYALEYVLGEFDCFYQAVFLLTAVSDSNFSKEEIAIIKDLTDFADVFHDKNIESFANLTKEGFEEIVTRCSAILQSIPELIKIVVELDRENEEIPNHISALFNSVFNSMRVFIKVDDMGEEGVKAESNAFFMAWGKVFEYAESQHVEILGETGIRKKKEAKLDVRFLERKDIVSLPYEAKSDMEEIKKHVEKALIYIEVETEKGRASGSGFIISPNGYAITCCHVVEGAKEIRVRIRPNGEKGPSIFSPAKVIAQLEFEDIALIHIDAVDLSYVNMLPLEKNGEVGEKIFLFGYPLGEMLSDSRFLLNYSMTQGNISARQKKEGFDLTLIDILAVQGNSGGPIISATTGEVLGVLLGAFVPGSAPIVYMRPIKYVWERFTK